MSLEEGRRDLFSDHRMLLDGAALVLSQLGVLAKHAVWNPDLPDIVQLAAQVDLANVVLGQAQGAGNEFGVEPDPSGVAAGVCVLRLDGLDHRLHSVRKQAVRGLGGLACRDWE